jgi:hypothetical protein
MPVRVTFRGKFYDKDEVLAFVAKHGKIKEVGITHIGWDMPSKMALDFVKGFYTNPKLKQVKL